MSIISPNRENYNDYGVKITMNELFIVKVQNEFSPPSFLIQFAPYTSSGTSRQCIIYFPETVNYYIYTVIIGKNQTQFFFAGELIDETNGTFIGVVKYNSSQSNCSTQFSCSSQNFSDYEHQEYHVIATEPQGRYAYGFSNKFLYIYDSQTNSIVNLWNGSLTWIHDSFMPHAVDIFRSYGIIAGFIRNPFNTVSKYIPAIYLINFNSSNNRPMIIDLYLPNATAETWQDLLTNADADLYSAKYDMSVSINNQGYVLVGMQFINRVFYFSLNLTNPIRLNYINRRTNGRSLGNGKSIAWLNDGIAAILVNTYTLNYQWLSSEIFFYDIRNQGYNNNTRPLSIFPNNHQLLPSHFSPVFTHIVSSPSVLTLLDDHGNILILNPTAPGFYPSVYNTRKNVVFTFPQPCLPGRYKDQSGVYDCLLCPTGRKNPGNANVQCLPCSNGSFCSLGAVNDVPISALTTTMQVIAYPKSPESTIFDDILIQNMFYINSHHCLRISPLFWTLIMGGFVIIMIIIMGILKIYIYHPQSKWIRSCLKSFFKHADLINEGEFWIGGLASFCVIVLVSFAYAFSAKFLNQYPIETSSDSHFACDLSLRNAKFETSIQSLSIPAAEFEQAMIDLLDHQNFTLHVDFVNTIMKCDVASIQGLYGSKWTTVRWLDCYNNNSILSISIPLDFQRISIQIHLSDIQSIGGLRVGLSGSIAENEHLKRKELHFYRSFYKDGQILAQNLPILLELTKVINETRPLIDEESDYTGIYIPTFTIDTDSLFLNTEQYIQLNSTSTIVTIDIHETPYYVKNLQQPIAKRSEIIFHNLLFTSVCLEIFGLGFLLYKLVIKPLCHLFFPQYFFLKKKQIILQKNQIKK